jgi:hypothetical protein
MVDEKEVEGLGTALGDMNVSDDNDTDDTSDFLSDLKNLDKSDAQTTEKATDEVKTETPTSLEDYEWTPPEDFKDKWEAKGEEGQKEYDEFKSYAKEKGIQPEVFKELMDKYINNTKSIPSKLEKDLEKEWNQTVDKWHNTILADKEVGGANYKASKKNAIVAIKEFGGNELAEELLNTGFGNNPLLFKAFAKAGRLLQEEGGFSSGSPIASKKPIHEQIYK